MDKIQPVFIIGYPRSGTTLLLHFLMSSEQFPSYDFDESHFFSHYYLRFGSLENHGNRTRFIQALKCSDWVTRSLVNVSELNATKSQSSNYVDYFEEIMNCIALRQNQPRWLEKTPWHILYVDIIKKQIPTSKFILIVRDPRDVVLSIDQYGWNKGWLKGLIRSAIAWKWHMQNLEKMIKLTHPDILTIRYEDLVLNPELSANQLSEFLKLDISLQSVNRTSKGVLHKSNSSYLESKSSPVYRWKDENNQSIVALLNYIFSDELAKYGYELPEEENITISKRALLLLSKIVYFNIKKFRILAFPYVRR